MLTQFIIFSAQYLHLVIFGVAVVFVLLKLSADKKHLLATGVVASFIALLLDKVLNQIIQSPRPFIVEKVTPLFSHVADNGFPSEHTLFVMIIAGVIFIYHRKAGVFFGVLALWVGLTRVIAKVHHFTDILGSIAIVIVAVTISWYLLAWLKRKNIHNSLY